MTTCFFYFLIQQVLQTDLSFRITKDKLAEQLQTSDSLWNRKKRIANDRTTQGYVILIRRQIAQDKHGTRIFITGTWRSNFVKKPSAKDWSDQFPRGSQKSNQAGQNLWIKCHQWAVLINADSAHTFWWQSYYLVHTSWRNHRDPLFLWDNAHVMPSSCWRMANTAIFIQNLILLSSNVPFRVKKFLCISLTISP